VFKGDPADASGIRPRDIILEVKGKPIEDSRDLTRTIANTQVGETIEIKVLREGREKWFKVKIAKREDGKLAGRRPERRYEDELGIRVSEVTPEMMRRFNLDKAEGVLVVAVEPDSKGSEAGILKGDLIKEINHQKIKTVKDYENQIKKSETVEMLIKRQTGFVVVKFKK
jgi:serine protease Do